MTCNILYIYLTRIHLVKYFLSSSCEPGLELDMKSEDSALPPPPNAPPRPRAHPPVGQTEKQSDKGMGAEAPDLRGHHRSWKHRAASHPRREGGTVPGGAGSQFITMEVSRGKPSLAKGTDRAGPRGDKSRAHGEGEALGTHGER